MQPRIQQIQLTINFLSFFPLGPHLDWIYFSKGVDVIFIVPALVSDFNPVHSSYVSNFSHPPCNYSS